MKKFMAGLIAGVILMMGVAYAASTSIEVSFLPLKYFFDGVQKTPEANMQGFIYNGTTYVPLRFMAESLGKDVIWNERTQSIFVNSRVSEGRRDIVSFEDGTYRGIFADGSEFQVGVQFTLENNIITRISFRHLAYSGINYRTEQENEKIIGLRKQHEELINYLVGRDIRANIRDLYRPENIITTEVDGFTGATVRSGKIISAIRDGLNRGVYSY